MVNVTKYIANLQIWYAIKFIAIYNFALTANASKQHANALFCIQGNQGQTLLQIIVFPPFLACICRYGQTTIFAKRVNLSKYLQMLMVCTCGKFEANFIQTFPFTTHLHINSHETNIQVLPRFTSQCK